MNTYEHLPLTPYQGEVKRQTRGGGGGYKLPDGRIKREYSIETTNKIDSVILSFNAIKNKYSGIINPSLIFEIEINQGVDFKSLEQTMASMGIHILASAENKKGYWIVFSDDENLNLFRKKLVSYGSPDGHKYDFFNAFGELRYISREEKIGERLKSQPLSDIPEFIDIELWRMTNEEKNKQFIKELKIKYTNQLLFRITDQIITKSFVLLRVKITKIIFDEIIELKEISRADRPWLPVFNPFNLKSIDLSEIERQSPDENSAGILIIDSGIISNHPLLEKCIGGEDNFQDGETATHDTVGHGTAVAGCAAYGDIEKCVINKKFFSSNWIFSAKVMYADNNTLNGQKMTDVYITPKSVLDYIDAKKAKRNEYQRRYYQKHRKQVLAYMKEWRIRNPDKRYGRDTEKNIEYMRKYYIKNREKILKDKTDYYYRKKAELLKTVGA